MTGRTISVRAQWALHGKVLDDEGYRVIASSIGDLSRANFADALGRFTIGALDIFMPALLKPGPRRLLHAIGADLRPLRPDMPPVIAGGKTLPAGYRPAGKQAIRVDMAEKLFRAAHERRAVAKGRRFAFDQALGASMGLTEESFARLMRDGGFYFARTRALPKEAHGPHAPPLWEWRAPRRDQPKDPRAGRRKGRPAGTRSAPAAEPPQLRPRAQPHPGLHAADRLG